MCKQTVRMDLSEFEDSGSKLWGWRGFSFCPSDQPRVVACRARWADYQSPTDAANASVSYLGV